MAASLPFSRPTSSLHRTLCQSLTPTSLPCSRSHNSFPLRQYSTTTPISPTSPPTLAPPRKPSYPRPVDFHPGNIYRHHREQALQFRPLPVPTHPYPSIKRLSPDPISHFNSLQLSSLDPRGVRTRLFASSNPERVAPGDIILVRTRDAEPISGVVLSIRKRETNLIDAAVLIRNTLTRVGTEMWIKIYSPSITGIEIVQRSVRKVKRARLFYLRSARHDPGSLEGVVRTYLKGRSGIAAGLSSSTKQKIQVKKK